MEYCVTIHIQNTYPDMRRAMLQTHFSTAITQPCWTRRNRFFGQDNVMPCLKPTKGGRVVLRNDAQRELRYTSTACTDSSKRQLLDELTFMLILTFSQMLLNNAILTKRVSTCIYTTKLKKANRKFQRLARC